MHRLALRLCALAALVLPGGCHLHDGCRPLASRCDGNVAQLCDPDGAWIVVADCEAVSRQTGEPWECVESVPLDGDAGVDGATCLPIDPRPRVAEVFP